VNSADLWGKFEAMCERYGNTGFGTVPEEKQ